MADQLFSDSIYPAAMVDEINATLAKRSPAIDTWIDIEEITLEHTGHRSLDTAPRDFLMCVIIEDLKLPGWLELAKAWGFKSYGRSATIRPRYPA